MNTNDIAIELPSSKSLSNRWLILNHLAGGKIHIARLSDSDDTRLLRQLLAQLQKKNNNLYYCNNAGSVARFLMAVLAITPGNHVLTGDERLLQRPMAPLIDTLRSLGANITCTAAEGSLPVKIEGGSLHHRTASIDPSMSSQFVSALLLIAPTLPDGLSLTMTSRAASRPYINMTCEVLRQCGVQVRQSSNGRTFYVEHCGNIHTPQNIYIERDWTAASYFYTAAALRPDLRIRLKNLSVDSLQGDNIVDSFFAKLGVRSREVRQPYRKTTRSITLSGGGVCDKQIAISCIDNPDLAPTFAVACAALKVRATLRGLQNLGSKESNRLLAIEQELKRMGAKIKIDDGKLVILPSNLHPTEPVQTYNDHRMAMAFAPLSLIFDGLKIEHPEVVAKSFPTFWEQFDMLQNH